jgi:uracil phosphoribosyltransferase
LVTEADEKSGDNILSRAIKSFDISEVEISLISNKGEGYKTSWNTIITVVFLAGVVWFILFAGLFELSPTYKVETISLLRDESVYPKATLNPEDIIFFIKKLPTSNFNLDAVLLDENDEIIENITLL